MKDLEAVHFLSRSAGLRAGDSTLQFCMRQGISEVIIDKETECTEDGIFEYCFGGGPTAIGNRFLYILCPLVEEDDFFSLLSKVCLSR